MTEELTFYRCYSCGNIITKLHDSTMSVVCCNERMKPLKPNDSTGDPMAHKPVLVVEEKGVRVMVGEKIHPCDSEHYIQWICIQTNKGEYIRYLSPGDTPETFFIPDEGEQVIAAYAYCNIHGLWCNKL